ncbi:MAG: hypothetical protein ACRC33_15775 [Gemmataceae bacterium]
MTDQLARYEAIIAALERAGFGTSFRPDVPGGMLVCVAHPKDDEGFLQGRSIVLSHRDGHLVLFEWGGIPAYAAPSEAQLVACIRDFLRADDVTGMAVNDRLIRTYALVRDGGFEAEVMAEIEASRDRP